MAASTTSSPSTLACRAGDDDDGAVDWEPVRANRRVWDRICSSYKRRTTPRSAASRSCGERGRCPKVNSAHSAPSAGLAACGSSNGVAGCQSGDALAAEGAVVVGLDLSGGQLQAARARAPDLMLVHAAAETLPFRSETFDLVFCDHGALSWSDPTYAVAEATRVLVPGGGLVFNTASPWLRVCYENSSDRITAGLHHSYFDLGALDEGDGARTYTLTYGEWIPGLPRQWARSRGPHRASPGDRRRFELLHKRPGRLGQSLARRNPLGDSKDRVRVARGPSASRLSRRQGCQWFGSNPKTCTATPVGLSEASVLKLPASRLSRHLMAWLVRA